LSEYAIKEVMTLSLPPRPTACRAWIFEWIYVLVWNDETSSKILLNVKWTLSTKLANSGGGCRHWLSTPGNETVGILDTYSRM
jgi:hypothetical protein